MKTILILVACITLVSCKKDYTCVCDVTINYNIVSDSAFTDGFKTTTSMYKLTKKEAKASCRNKTEVSEYSNFTVNYDYNCKLK